MYIEIDQQSGFCHGVVNAIKKAEQELAQSETLYCLGDIVHNGQEVQRLTKQGLKTIDYVDFGQLKNAKVLLRAHGEPPETYQVAQKNGITIIDASCRVVLNIQKKIKKAFEEFPQAQIVIYGKHGHAEVLGLVGQTDNTAIVIENEDELHKVDMQRDIILFSQTTKSVTGFKQLVSLIESNRAKERLFEHHDTICRQVSNRIPNIKTFAQRFDLVLFVSGKKSSNGQILFQECLKVNSNTHFISNYQDIDYDWIANVSSIGICGATSTPKWLMEEVEQALTKHFQL